MKAQSSQDSDWSYASLCALASKTAPGRLTREEALDWGRKVQREEVAGNISPYVDVDVFSRFLPYHDKIRHVKYDLAHEIANIIKQVFSFIGNRKSGGINAKRRFKQKHTNVCVNVKRI
jgi:hypothetical protein